MPKKIAVIHATRVSLDPVAQSAAQFPDVELLHLMDEGMSYLAKAEGGRISGVNMARMAALLHSADELNVDGILLSCTIFSPYIDLLRSFTDLPLVAADVGMFEQAAARYQNIGVVVSFEPTLQSVRAVLDRCRQRINPSLRAEVRLAEGAFAAMQHRDAEEHNRLLYETACAIADGKDAIVLAQMSHMRALPLFENFPLPVLTSPPVSLDLLCRQIDARRGKA